MAADYDSLRHERIRSRLDGGVQGRAVLAGLTTNADTL